ncbi:DUF2333 family protein [Dongia sedimenti]|uniref:DUF2333 family protein n=1 Tax=Dongia sedimenti TaxID=3064282 RepID=A0ABU0YNQ2_9PROT|nr:DUF2333 family protein [Rhodospirillaceae bacterium R-7]
MSDDLLIDEPPVRRRFYSRWFGGALGPSRDRHWLWRLLKWLGILLLLVVVLYYPVGMMLTHEINDDPNFSAATVDQGASPEQRASQAVATAAALMNREVNQTAWPANDPFFMPGWALDNMPNFQIGIRDAVKRFALELQDEIGRNRGTSAADPDLQTAAGSFNYAPDVWVWNPGTSFMPTATSDEQYRQGVRALLAYNARLAQGKAAFERRADNLLSTLDRIGKDLGAASDRTQRQIDGSSGTWIDFHADDVFYLNKGLLYADALILRDLGKDFADILKEKGAQNIWDRMVTSMMEGAQLRPWIVINGRPDALMQPNHLAAQGFYLIRARAQLEELGDVLIK